MESEIKDFLENIIKQKESIVSKLTSILESTDSFYEGNQIALALTDHFRGNEIESCLVNLIQNPKWKMSNGTLLFALGEYTSSSKYLYFLVDMILKNEKNNDGEIFMGAYSMIINLHPPLDGKEITRSIQRVKRESKKGNITKNQKLLIQSLLKYLEGQREIAKFYKQFG